LAVLVDARLGDIKELPELSLPEFASMDDRHHLAARLRINTSRRRLTYVMARRNWFGVTISYGKVRSKLAGRSKNSHGRWSLLAHLFG
jgi:hypothetical protein